MKKREHGYWYTGINGDAYNALENIQLSLENHYGVSGLRQYVKMLSVHLVY